MARERLSRPAEAGCLIIFALPFAAVGVFMIGMLLSTLWTWAGMQSWEEVPAVIRGANLAVNHSGDGDTYRVKAAYTYEYGGRAWSGDKVSNDAGSDNVGSFHQNAFQELQAHRDTGTPFRCYVNPGNPAEAVLYRDLRFGMLGIYALFGLVFGGVGFGLIGAVFVTQKMQRAKQALQKEHPDQPWIWRKDWRAGVIRSSNKGQMLVSIAVAAFWNAVSSPLLFVVPGELRAGNLAVLFALLFPLVGAGLFVWAARNVIRWRKFGETTFQMAAVPGVIGGPLYGLIRIPTYLRPDEGFQMRLRCVRRVTTGSGKNKSTQEHTLWEREQLLAREEVLVDPVQAAVPVRFAIPCDAPASDPDAATPIVWKLEVHAATPGVDYSATFEVPVFKTEASSPDFNGSAAEETAVADEIEPERALSNAGILTRASAGGAEFYFPRGRQKGALIAAGVLFLVFCGTAAGLWGAGAPVLFPIVFGLVAALVLPAFLDGIFGSLRVTVTSAEICVRRGFLVWEKERRVSKADIRDVKHASNSAAGNQRYYQVVLETADGRKVTVGSGIPGEWNARGYVAALRRALDA